VFALAFLLELSACGGSGGSGAGGGGGVEVEEEVVVVPTFRFPSRRTRAVSWQADQQVFL